MHVPQFVVFRHMYGGMPCIVGATFSWDLGLSPILPPT